MQRQESSQSLHEGENTQSSPNKKVVVLNCNCFNDGNGDIGNVFDVAKKILEFFGKENVTFYFVITGHNKIKFKYNNPEEQEQALEDQKILREEALKQALKYFKEQFKYEFKNDDLDLSQHVFSFLSNDHVHCEEEPYPEFQSFLKDNPQLQKIYANADLILNIATPFPSPILDAPLQLKVQPINIVEHGGSSYTHLNSRISNPPEHYVTGLSPKQSGLMISDLSCTLDQSIHALQSIKDKSYIEKLGLNYPVSTEDAKQFLESTLIIPAYLGANNSYDLAPLFHLVSNSPLASSFKKIIFHVNQRSYDASVYSDQEKELERFKNPHFPEVQLIAGHYFDDPDDFDRVFALHAWCHAPAVIGSDKVLEKTISYNRLPIYVPPDWKESVHKDLLELFGKDTPFGLFLELCKKNDYFYGEDMDLMSAVTTNYQSEPAGKHYSDYLTNEAISAFQEIRKSLLQHSFYDVLNDKILKPLMGQVVASQTVSEANTAKMGVFKRVESSKNGDTEKLKNRNPWS